MRWQSSRWNYYWNYGWLWWRVMGDHHVVRWCATSQATTLNGDWLQRWFLVRVVSLVVMATPWHSISRIHYQQMEWGGFQPEHRLPQSLRVQTGHLLREIPPSAPTMDKATKPKRIRMFYDHYKSPSQDDGTTTTTTNYDSSGNIASTKTTLDPQANPLSGGSGGDCWNQYHVVSFD